MLATNNTMATKAGGSRSFVTLVAPVFVRFVADMNSLHALRSARR
jgi:hypothetical protein